MSKPEWFMGFADHAATKSKDSTKVGAALIRDGVCVLTSYNGPPQGVRDLPERFERPMKYLYAAHAEQNLISFAARLGIRTEDAVVYCTHHPCSSCAKSLIQAGIRAVIYGTGQTKMPADKFLAAATMFNEAQVVCVLVEKERALYG